MKKIIFIFAVLVLTFSSSFAQNSAWTGKGIGVVLEESPDYDNFGVTAKFWQTPFKKAIVVNAETNYYLSSLGVFAAYQFYFDPFKIPKGKLPLYHGPEVGLAIWDANDYYNDDGIDIGVRFSWDLGVEYMFAAGTPIGIFTEMVPTFQFTFNDNDNDSVASLQLAVRLGARYFF